MPENHAIYSLNLGLPRMQNEPGEKRDFLPEFAAICAHRGIGVVLEHGYGSGMGFNEEDYLRLAPGITFADHATTMQQDYVLVLRCPKDDELRMMRTGACLISMLHFPTRPLRVLQLRKLGLEAISLDSLKDDSNRRMVENLRAVAWNGCRVAFGVLRAQYPSPGFDSPDRPPVHVTLMGAGAVGSHVVQAAIRYGDQALWKEFASRGIPGVQVTVIDYDTTTQESLMRDILGRTDLLIDATQRPDPSVYVIPNPWISWLPKHTVLLDLSVDPYDCTVTPPEVKGIEGIPHGNLDQYVFPPDDPAYSHLPTCVRTDERRTAVSCYSWPGIYPRESMQVYGRQILPILRTLLEVGGVAHIPSDGTFFKRAISRAMLSRWTES
jgi:alanine dehydrogenase